MTYVTLIQDPMLSLASDKLVIPATELPAVLDAVDLASNLARLLNEEKHRIEAAERDGFENGYERGREEGLRQALDDLSTGLKALSEKMDRREDELQRSVARLAIEIVRKIAVEVGAREMVVSLAQTAARELVSTERIVVAVHPKMLETVVEQLRMPTGKAGYQRLEVQADDALDPFDCVLHTKSGSVVAGLDAQLENLQRVLEEAGEKSAVEPVLCRTWRHQ
ncbi:FliH/SctL family protein [Thiolapillus sp.]